MAIPDPYWDQGQTFSSAGPKNQQRVPWQQKLTFKSQARDIISNRFFFNCSKSRQEFHLSQYQDLQIVFHMNMS